MTLQTLTDDIRWVPLRSPTLLPATHTNAWILGRDRLTVVDPGSPWDDEQRRLVRVLEELGTVERVVLTHHHHDHVRGAAPLAEHFDVPIHAHPATGQRLSFETRPLDHFGTLATDTQELVAYHTPGHAPGHIVLVTSAGHIVAGDMVAGVGTISIDPGDDGHLRTYFASLELLKELDPKTLLPAHGPPIREPQVLLQHYIDHRHSRTEQIRQALEQLGSARTGEIARIVYKDLDPRFHMLAAVQISSHLVWLEEDGRAKRSGRVWSLT